MILADIDVSSTTLTNIYTVPQGKNANVLLVTLANRSASDDNVSLSVAGSGAANSNSQYLLWKKLVRAQDTFLLNGLLQLASGDVVRAKSETGAALTCVLVGTESTQGDILLSRQITLSTAQILALNATPVEIIPAPGSGLYLIPVAVFARLNFNTTAFAAGSTVALRYGTSGGPDLEILTNTQMAAVATKDFSVGPAFNASLPIANTRCLNSHIEVYAESSAFTTGDGSLDIVVLYSTIALP